MQLIDNPKGNYRFLTGIAPYSSGVTAIDGYEIVHVTLKTLLSYRMGFELIDEYLSSLGRPRHALCGIELRSPKPFSFEGFAEYNQGYQDILADWDLPFNGRNPIARTNIALEVGPPEEPSLYAFSYTVPCRETGLAPTFVIAGAGEFAEGKQLTPDGIVRAGETSIDAIQEKAERVMNIMQARLTGLNLTWADVTVVDIYTVHSLYPLLPETILKTMDHGVIHGVRWFYGRPPIVGLEFEMDMRGIRQDIVIDS